MALDGNITSVEPTGVGRVLFVLAIVFLIPTSIVVALRCVTRLKHHIFGIDDGLMLFGWMLHVAFSAIAIQCVYSGLGTKDKDLNGYLQLESRKFLYFGQLAYSISLIPLKGSICVTLLRIAVSKVHRIIIWSVFTLTVVATTAIVIGCLVGCRPIAANWGQDGKCAPYQLMAAFGYLMSCAAVVTDFVCAILPVFMLYKSQMKATTKISVGVVLGLAALASLCTIIRLPYLKYYTIQSNYLYNVTNIVLWSLVESGIGIIAGSLPSLRKLVSRRWHFNPSAGSSPTHNTPYTGTNRVVITANTTTAGRRTREDGGVGEWEQLDDSASTKKIYVKVDLEMQTLERPQTQSQGSREDLVW
ncbi:Ff.00g003320.m01.CDS01 [Fusarium sp. VM40]|nr:Ff.00g003320.m01.CDS01 [Fusarium sp. VM40]